MFDTLSGNRSDSERNERFDSFISILILLNVVAVILESYESINDDYGTWLRGFEYFSVVVFSIEYLLRLWTASLQYPHLPAWRAVLKFMFSTFGLIDLLAVLPFYLPFFFKLDLRFMRMLRMVRLLRVLKLSRHSRSLLVIRHVLKETKNDLIATLFVTFILITVASTIMYYVEQPSQPEQFSNIGQAFWWAVATLTTVGYGDIYPVTAIGKLLSGAIAILGIGLVALPTGIVSSAFIEKMQEMKAERKARKAARACPHCGKEIHE